MFVRYAYLCDRKQCKNCHDYCHHTTDIDHAVNRENIESGKAKFKQVGPEMFFEIEEE